MLRQESNSNLQEKIQLESLPLEILFQVLYFLTTQASSDLICFKQIMLFSHVSLNFQSLIYDFLVGFYIKEKKLDHDKKDRYGFTWMHWAIFLDQFSKKQDFSINLEGYYSNNFLKMKFPEIKNAPFMKKNFEVVPGIRNVIDHGFNLFEFAVYINSISAVKNILRTFKPQLLSLMKSFRCTAEHELIQMFDVLMDYNKRYNIIPDTDDVMNEMFQISAYRENHKFLRHLIVYEPYHQYITSFNAHEIFSSLLLLFKDSCNQNSNIKTLKMFIEQFRIHPNVFLLESICCRNIAFVKEALKLGANINFADSIVDFKGNTPLHILALDQNINLFIFLLNRGANFEIKNNNGKTCIDKISSLEKLASLKCIKLNSKEEQEKLNLLIYHREKHLILKLPLNKKSNKWMNMLQNNKKKNDLEKEMIANKMINFFIFRQASLKKSDQRKIKESNKLSKIYNHLSRTRL